MKEKIDRLSKGIFEYEMPKLIVSTEVLELTVDAGTQTQGSIRISNSAATKMKGVLYVTGRVLTLLNNKFIGVDCEIPYTVDATFMQAGETHSGTISIISDCGERQIPFNITTVQPCCKSSLGPVRDLFHFTNLARTNWQEAVQLFSSPTCFEVILKSEPKLRLAYEQLSESPSEDRAMEQFLVMIHKKKSCTFSVQEKELNFSVRKESFMERLTITKEQWGYLDLTVTTDAPYLRLPKTHFVSEDFTGGQAELEFVIEAEQMNEGTHYSELVFATVDKVVRIPVTCHVSRTERESARRLHALKRYEAKVTEQYLAFRNMSISSGAFLAESGKLLESILILLDKETSEGNGDAKTKELLEIKRNTYELYRAYLSIVDGKNRLDEERLQAVLRRKSEYERNHTLFYCAVLYLETMKTRDRAMVEQYAAIIRERYEQNPTEAMLLWFLLYMEKRLEENKALRYESIKNLCMKGCNSPIFYYEAVALWKAEPALLRELTHFECMVMRYMLKSGQLNKEVAVRFAYLAERVTEHEGLVLRLLRGIYAKFAHRDILEAICKLIVRMGSKKPEYHAYLKQGVKEQLKIEGIYDYYLYTLEQEANPVIDQPVLLYYSYNNALSGDYTAFLYSYVVRNKDSNPAIYRAYLKKMEQFAVNQMKAGAVSSHLAVIYADVLRKSIIDREMAQTLPDIIFTYQLVTERRKMTAVCVAHKEEKEACVIPLSEPAPFMGLPEGARYALVPIYTENAEVFLLDAEGNRYLMSEEDKLYRLMHGEDFLDACYEIGSDNRRLLLHIGEKNNHYNKYDQTLIELQKQLSHMEGLREETLNDCILSLVDYYYENYEGELLETYLNEVKLPLLSVKQREKILGLMIIRDMYDKVIEAVGEFGCDGLPVKRLQKLCLRGIHSQREEKDREILLTIAFFAFRQGRVEEGLLQYLAELYNGTTAEMFELWQTAKAREVDTTSLEERLLGQMLFAESYVEDSYAVFFSYYGSGMNRKLIRAYLSYSAYKYFVNDRVTNTELFEILKKEPFLENSQICILALLKYYAGKPSLSEAEKTFADYHIQKLEQKKMIFAFFKDFEGRIPLPACMLDKYYIEYRTNPKKKVVLHYTCCDNAEAFTEEVMTDIGYGIFVKEIILFYGETLQYFITEESENGTEITESCSVRYVETEREGGNLKYGRINEILMTKDLQDEKTLLSLLEQYYKTEYAVKRHFSPV
ncbi:MAG: DUF5717 family protein [Lachnospiraceae bacterium]